MTTSIFRVAVAERFAGMATRSVGDSALAETMRLLSEVDSIELDFGGEDPSPSFADQFVGGLAQSLGFDDFRRRVKLKNVPPAAVPLLRFVISRKADLHRVAVPT